MRIVVLDGFALNPGDISWSELHALGDVTIYDRTEEKDIVSRAKEADAILLNKCPMTKDTLSLLPNLKYIGVLATGYNVVDTAFAKERGVAVALRVGSSQVAVLQGNGVHPFDTDTFRQIGYQGSIFHRDIRG